MFVGQMVEFDKGWLNAALFYLISVSYPLSTILLVVRYQMTTISFTRFEDGGGGRSLILHRYLQTDQGRVIVKLLLPGYQFEFNGHLCKFK